MSNILSLYFKKAFVGRKVNNRNIRAIYFFNIFSCFRPHWPIAVIYFEHITHSYTLAASIFSIVFISQALSEIPTGILSDFLGRKKTLLSGGICAFIGIALYAFGMNYWILALGAVFEGLSKALYSGTKDALVYESLKETEQEDKFEDILGKTNSVEQVSLAVSAGVGGILSFISLDFVFIIAVIPQVLCALSTLYITNPVKCFYDNENKATQHFTDAVKHLWKNKKLRLISLAETLDFGFGEALFYFQGAFYQTIIPTWLIGFVRCLNHTFSALGFWFAGRIINIFGYKKTLIKGTFLVTLIEYSALIIPSVLSPFIITLGSLFFGSANTARSSLMHQEFNDKQRATLGSIVSLTSSVFFSTFSLALGGIADFYSPRIAMLVGISSNFIILYVYTRVFRGNNSSEFPFSRE